MINKPLRPFFGSGPTAKPLGWSLSVLEDALVSRSHRSAEGIAAIQQVLDLTRQVLEIPQGHQIAFVPGSATGAVEIALWNFLGTRPVDVFVTDVFGKRWADDLIHHRPCVSVNLFQVPAGHPFPLEKHQPFHDALFLWNASTAGTKIPDDYWISEQRQGLTLCDATSAVYGMALPWEKLDVTAFSWQKGLGSEPGVGVLVLSPRALTFLEKEQATQHVPFMLNLRPFNRSKRDLFQGKTLNTLSMLSLEDARWCHQWALEQGGLKGLIKKCDTNSTLIKDWLDQHPFLAPVAQEHRIMSPMTMCFRFKNHSYDQWPIYDHIANLLKENHIAYDCLNHRACVPAFRVWGGPTVESCDLKALLDCIDFFIHTLP